MTNKGLPVMERVWIKYSHDKQAVVSRSCALQKHSKVQHSPPSKPQIASIMVDQSTRKLVTILSALLAMTASSLSDANAAMVPRHDSNQHSEIRLENSSFTTAQAEAMTDTKGKLPYATERNDEGEIIVDESNFTIAETDRYFVDHSKEHKVNTFRHSREMSTVENQFVVRENRDVMYSHAVVDISKGATLVNPEWDVFSMIQVIDENQYTIASIYPGEQKTFTPKDVALGNHVFLNMRTGVRSLDEKGFSEAHQHQDSVVIDAKSAKPYKPKGFEAKSLDETRARLKARMAEADKPEFYFGTKDEIEPTQFLIASAVGIFGLPIKDAAYLNTIQPTGAAKKGAPSRITLPRPPLDFDKGGFFSVTTYDAKGWIAKENYALNNNTAKANEDGSITFHFNAPGKPNNIDVVEDWTMLIRLYAPTSKEAIMKYMKDAEQNIRVELIKD